MARAVRCDNKGRSDVLIVHRVGVTDANVNRPFITLAPLVCGLSQSQSIGTLDYHGLLLKFQRRFANNFSIMNSSLRDPWARNRPNSVCDGKLSNPTIDKWFDTSCFVATSDVTGTYGDAGRGILRGPGSFNIDASSHQAHEVRAGRHGVPPRGIQRAESSAVRTAEHHVRQRERQDPGDAVESVLLALRHDGTAGAARVQDALLDWPPGEGRRGPPLVLFVALPFGARRRH